VNFPCFKGNRVNIQGVLSDKATKKSVHKFWRNLEFSFMTRITLKLFLNTGAARAMRTYSSRAKRLYRASLIDRLNRDHSEDRGK